MPVIDAAKQRNELLIAAKQAAKAIADFRAIRLGDSTINPSKNENDLRDSQYALHAAIKAADPEYYGDNSIQSV